MSGMYQEAEAAVNDQRPERDIFPAFTAIIELRTLHTAAIDGRRWET
jgi:hypothetical protein